MASALRNCVSLLDVPLPVALRHASSEPARFLGVDHDRGMLKTGLRADMVALEPGVSAFWEPGSAASGRLRRQSPPPAEVGATSLASAASNSSRVCSVVGAVKIFGPHHHR